MTKEQTIKELTIIPGIGKSLATDLWNIGITSIDDLKGKDPAGASGKGKTELVVLEKIMFD